MFLSNPRKTLLLTCVFAFVFGGCGGAGKNVQPGTGEPIKTKFPFAVTEPEVYQGDFVVSVGGVEDRCHLARKGDKWRIDYFNGEEKSRSAMRTDQLYSIDH